MPVKTPNRDPNGLFDEHQVGYFDEHGIYRIDIAQAIEQKIRPLRIGIINIMGSSDRNETYLAIQKLLSGTPLQLEIVNLSLESNINRQGINTREQYLKEGAIPFEKAANKGLDGLIVTGAGYVSDKFSDNSYWNELNNILSWANENVAAQLLYCWAAHAGLQINHKIDRVPNIPEESQNPEKIFGVFNHTLTSSEKSPFPFIHHHSNETDIWLPHSRINGINEADIYDNPYLETLISGNEPHIGPTVIAEKFREEQFSSILYNQGHPEYPFDRLAFEYKRDLNLFNEGKRSTKPNLPANYDYKNPKNNWIAHGRVIYDAFLNMIYQRAYYEIPKDTYKSA